MANEQNLKKIETLSKEEATRRGSLGGIASVKARREKKMMREIALKMLNASLSPEAGEQLGIFGLKKGDLTWNAAILAKQINKAVKGDTNSAKFLLEVSGQKEAEKVELSGGTRNEVVIAKDQITADLYNKLMEGDGD